MARTNNSSAYATTAKETFVARIGKVRVNYCIPGAFVVKVAKVCRETSGHEDCSHVRIRRHSRKSSLEALAAADGVAGITLVSIWIQDPLCSRARQQHYKHAAAEGRARHSRGKRKCGGSARKALTPHRATDYVPTPSSQRHTTNTSTQTLHSYHSHTRIHTRRPHSLARGCLLRKEYARPSPSRWCGGDDKSGDVSTAAPPDTFTVMPALGVAAHLKKGMSHP